MEFIFGYDENTLKAPKKNFSANQVSSTNALPQEEIKPCTILLVDDDLDDRFAAIRQCKTSPLVKDIVELTDGSELISYMKEYGYYDHSIIRYNPLLIVLDLQMPGVNGYEILQELKSDPFLQEVPIIVLSSLSNQYPITKALGLGANGYLTKPLNLNKLEQFIPKGWQWPPESMW